MSTDSSNNIDNTNSIAVEPKRTKKVSRVTLLILCVITIILGSYGTYIFAASPAAIRNPKFEHYHFRMQVLVNGKAEDFSAKAYQTGYVKDQCNANLPEQPIHFHDNQDQFTHIHWEGMTGGMVMKYYGWNYIGGMNNALGYKLNNLSDIQKVTTHGNYLPDVSKDQNFYIYTGNTSGYVERSFDDWKNQNLEVFFNTTSNTPAHKINTEEQMSVLDKVFPKASAHGSAEDADGDDGVQSSETNDEKLTRINNLLGNVVIFVQNEEPSERQIMNRFDDLQPLTDSTCGG